MQVWWILLRWELQETGETSLLELFLQFSFDTNRTAPPPFWALYSLAITTSLLARLSGGLKRNLGMPALIRGTDKGKVFCVYQSYHNLLQMHKGQTGFALERRKHCNLLRGYGWRGAMWGIKRRVF